ncbi:TM2 domain-containing protein 2-like isoform X2 [Anneissia japonica]|uniref:TM2 domain-containing protein 2-like isoform X2 n=1 Tax=Anneissia japonica TaxID=1529436 RepID=UPI00142564C8|nr:TM2 domain-containing protein 2-like isoform X2 [Anneissia japonica]
MMAHSCLGLGLRTLLVLFSHMCIIRCYIMHIDVPEATECLNESCGVTYQPESALILCSNLPDEFFECDQPKSIEEGNETTEDGGCKQYGKVKYQDVETTKVICRPLAGIQCYGSREFNQTVPCVN